MEKKSTWTHLALHVRELETSIPFYENYTNLRVIERHSDKASTGMEVAWLSDREPGRETEFVMVLQAGVPAIMPNAQPQSPLFPISHLGFAVESKEEVDRLANLAKGEGRLRFGPQFLNQHAGYLCIVADPDGHNVEFSFGQALGPKR
jgi:lactoylglutathione lyase